MQGKNDKVVINVAFIGAGLVNFGGAEGPWNHSKRLEQYALAHKDITFHVVAISDPMIEFAQKILERQRKNSEFPDLWQNTQIFASYMEMLEKVPKIDAAIIGVPPNAHGSTKPGFDIELQFAKRKIHMFIEKPISSYSISEVSSVASQLDELVKENKLAISVGYMFRYSKAIKKIKELIAQYGPPRIFNARYNCAYEVISKNFWWDNEKSGGPIVEQATHFCDLARFIVGDVDLDSVHALGILQTDALGSLNALAENVVAFEKTIPPERRIVRSTVATWKFKNGSIGTLTHGALLHGGLYETELEIWGDGYRIALLEPYFKCRLSVRLPKSEEVKILEYYDEDVYYEELSTWFDAILTGDSSKIESSYADAFQTYRLTWKIREQSEKVN